MDLFTLALAKKGSIQLNEDGLIPSELLPAYIDKIIEYDDISEFPQEGASGKIYRNRTTGYSYRWSGTAYVPLITDVSIASANTAGVIKVGQNLSIDGNGVMSADNQKKAIYVLEYYENPTLQQMQLNFNILQEIKNLNNDNEYEVYIKNEDNISGLGTVNISGSSIDVFAIILDEDITNNLLVYNIHAGKSIGFYNQKIFAFPACTTRSFLPESNAPASQKLIYQQLQTKQNLLTAGEGISINQNGVISVSYANGDEVEYGESNSNEIEA